MMSFYVVHDIILKDDVFIEPKYEINGSIQKTSKTMKGDGEIPNV